MMTPPTIDTTEWRVANLPHKTAAWLRANSGREKPETMGFHEVVSGQFRSGNFLGMVRVGEGDSRAVLRVSPKFAGMDYLAMFLQCADQLGDRMGECLRFWPEEPPIETEHAPDDFCGLVAAAFLRELNELHRRHLRRNFVRETENLRGKVKGKILTMENIRRNFSRGRGDRIVCAYQSVSDDIRENRILRAALERVAVFAARNPVYLAPRSGGEVMSRWIRAGRAALRGVSVVPVAASDHRSARTRGAFAHYKSPLRLARAVLESSGFDMEQSRPASVSPFALNSAELFERWAQLQLLKIHPELKASYQANTPAGPGGTIWIRPDFWIPKADGRPAMILDAKYKSAPGNVNDVSRDDIFQMVAYSRHCKFVQDKLGVGPDGEVELVLLYPQVRDGDIGLANPSPDKPSPDKSFFAPLSVWTIPCPQKAEAQTLAAAA